MIEKLITAFLEIDRFCNRITGGHPKATISARCGYFAAHGRKYWRYCEAVINWTFKPIDGKNHCLKAYRWETSIMPFKDFSKGNDFLKLQLAHIILLSCPIIAIILRIAVLVEPDIKHEEY